MISRYMVVACCALVAAANAAAGALAPYRQGDWKAVVASAAGRPLIVHFWGVTCGPCLVELPKWGRFMRERPEARVVFIEMDGTPEKAALRILADAGLGQADNRALISPFDEFTRHEIDPGWPGEMPSTMLVGTDGKVRRISGTADFAALRAWIAAQRAGVRPSR